ncbi:hypothetical protein CcaverHIS002_0704440 [Cutaneotrichosporon cavernicola]|nr:hypothetical protein CcaverHIS002_0704440 [Cutaneotrichosporon cavernicola]
MPNEDVQRDGTVRPPPPLQPRTRSPIPRALDAAKTDAVRQPSPLSHTPVRAAISRTSSAIAYGQTMYGVGIGNVAPLAPPRPKLDLDKEELTTKGRKRKRLAKACSACHKNKRRCDGLAPCSNCEFSARPCIYLNAQGEQIPPPRTRDSSATPMNKRLSDDDKPQVAAYLDQSGAATNGGSPEWRRDYRKAAGTDVRDWRMSGEHRPGPFGPIDLVERDPALQAELLDIALRRTPAYACMFHATTFHHRLYLNLIQPFLLDALYAMGARLCENPAFVKAFPPDTPSHKRGLVFADRCRSHVDRVIDARQRWSEDERKRDQGTWEETEFVQSCIVLSMIYNSVREARLGFYYLDVAASVMRPGANGQLNPPSQSLNLPPAEFFTMAEVRNRTFWLVVLQDICAVASGHPRRLSDAELARIPLPGPEMYWQRYGGMACNGREPGRRDTITVGSGNWHSEEGQVGEMGHIVRILIIFANIMSYVNAGNAADPKFSMSFEAGLKGWATELPRNLRFDEVNLASMMPKIKSTVPAIAFSGWAFAYMHAVAECGMFYLQSKHNGLPTAVQRQGSAVDNLAVLIGALGERGREGPLMFFPIMIVTCWTDHLHATSSSSSSSQMLDERLNIWWAELYREWGWDRRETLKRGIFPNLDSRSPTLTSPQPANRGRADGTHLASSPHLPESSASSAASQAVVTPSEPSFNRYPLLPPLRSRDRNESPLRRSASPLRGHRALGSGGSAGSLDRGERDGFNLPPLSSFRSSREGSREPRPLAAPNKRWPGPSGGQLLGIDALVSAAEEHRRESLEQPSAMA